MRAGNRNARKTLAPVHPWHAPPGHGCRRCLPPQACGRRNRMARQPLADPFGGLLRAHLTHHQDLEAHHDIPRQRHVGAAGPGPLIRQGKADQEAIQGFVAANKASMAWLACSGSNRVPFTRRHQQAALRQSSVPPRLVPAASAPDVAAPGVGHPGPPQRPATAPDPVGSSADRPALRPRCPGRLLNVN